MINFTVPVQVCIGYEETQELCKKYSCSVEDLEKILRINVESLTCELNEEWIDVQYELYLEAMEEEEGEAITFAQYLDEFTIH